MAKPKNATSLCLSDEARDGIARKAEELGVSKSAVMEMAVRWFTQFSPDGPEIRSWLKSWKKSKNSA